MLYPNLSRLPMLGATGGALPGKALADDGDDEPPPPPRPPPPPHSAARNEVLSDDALVTAILENIRDEDGDPETVCRMVENWCAKLSMFNRNACLGADGRANQSVWEKLCNRVFPNYRRAVFPPADTPEVNHHLLAMQIFSLDGSHIIQAYNLPWSGDHRAYTWRDWFRVLCATFWTKRRNNQAAVARYLRLRRENRARKWDLEKELERLAVTRPDRPPDVRLTRRMRDAESRRQTANYNLSKVGPSMVDHEKRHGRTADHKEYEEVPDYASKRVRKPVGGVHHADESDVEWDESDNSSEYEDSDVDYNTEEERALDREWGVAPTDDDSDGDDGAGPSGTNPFDDGGGDDDDED